MSPLPPQKYIHIWIEHIWSKSFRIFIHEVDEWKLLILYHAIKVEFFYSHTLQLIQQDSHLLFQEAHFGLFGKSIPVIQMAYWISEYFMDFWQSFNLQKFTFKYSSTDSGHTSKELLKSQNSTEKSLNILQVWISIVHTFLVQLLIFGLKERLVHSRFFDWR